jgi:PAS domain-containing protein
MDLESANAALQREAGERNRAGEETRLLNIQLEQSVAARAAELAEANQRLAWMAALVEHSNDAIISLDTKGCLLSWNPAAGTVVRLPDGGGLRPAALHACAGRSGR